MTFDDTLYILEAVKPIPATAAEVGIHPGKLQALTSRGLLHANTFKWQPAIYSLTDKGRALMEVLKEPRTLTPMMGTVARIKQIVSEHFRIPVSAMESRGRGSREVARPRQIAMYFARELTPLSLPHIGRKFGNRDHTTVIHAIRTVKTMIEESDDFRAVVEGLRNSLDSSTFSTGQLHCSRFVPCTLQDKIAA